MEEFLKSFNASHFVGLVFAAAIVYLARTLGRRFAKSVVELNDNLKQLNVVIAKVELLWDTHATPEMWRQLERMTQPRTAAPHEHRGS